MMKKVTIQDVAKELDLSRNTVAKALNNSETVAYETRYLVIKKAYEMGYSKLLPVILSEFNIKDSQEKTKTIAVMARKELSTFWNRIIMGISDEINKNNYKLRFNFISIEEEESLEIPNNLDVEVDGVIVLSVFLKGYIEKIKTLAIPVVFLDAPKDISKMLAYGDVLLFEGCNSVREMTSHMIEQGAKQIAFIGDTSYCRSMYERYRGFCLAMQEAEVTIDQELIKTKAMPRKYYIYKEVEDAIKSFPYMPDGIVCANDDIAKDVITCLKEKGIQIPKDVMVTGFDNKDETAFISPALTTAYISNQRMGKRLVQQLIWRMDNPEMPHEVVTVKTEVIYRESAIRRK